MHDAHLLLAALDRQPNGIAILSLPDLTYEYVNPAFQSCAPGKEMLGHPNCDVFPEMEFLAPHVLAALRKTGRPWRQKDALVRIRPTPSGPLEDRYATFEVSSLLLRGRLYLIVNAWDTTESVRLETERRQLHRDETRRLNLAETMAKLNRIIHSSLNYDDIMQRSLEEAVKALGAKAGAVFTAVSPEESEARYVFGFPEWLLDRRFPAKMFPFATLLDESGEPVPIEAERMQSLMNPELARQFRVRSMLAVPIVIRGRVTGGIGIIYNYPHEFALDEIDFCRTFGASVSLALANAKRYERQELVANALQETLLTLPDHVDGLHVAHTYRSATEATRVGGDFYDLFRFASDSIGITLGDMSGKGLDAIAFTSLVKNAIRTQTMAGGDSPGSVMGVINEVLLRSSGPETFATVFFATLDCRDWRLHYCNAGHSTIVLIREDGHVEKLPSNSPLVGAFARSSYDTSEVMLDDRDQLFMYTDGLIEARSDQEIFGERRLLELLAGVREDVPEALVQKVVDEVDAFTAGELHDDMAIVAIQRV